MDRIAAAICVIALSLTHAKTTCAQSPQRGSVQNAQRASLLVLKSGRVVRGVVSPRAGGYEVGQGLGRMFISAQTVRFQAADLNEAYRKMRATFSELTPTVHIEIAKWCLANNQIKAARQELLDALHLEPNNQTARNMLKRLEAGVAAKTRKPQKTLAQRKMDQFIRTEHESLGGLTDKQAAVFVSRVQPILEKSCGNSSCHGSRSTTGFVLTRSRGRTSRLTSERNLAVVLKQIQFDQPNTSPLLKAIDEPHTRDGRPIFSGPAGKIQEKIVRDWVTSMTAGSSRSVATQRPSTTPAIGATEQTQKTVASTQASIRTEPASAVDGATRTLTNGEQETLKQIREANENDPFDPDVFNRRYHGIQKQTKSQSNQ